MTLLAALLIDALFGEPTWLWSRVPHPVVLFGKLITFSDQKFNNGSGRRAKGVMLVTALIVICSAFAWIVALIPFGWIIEIVLGAILLAHRSLVDHVSDVAKALAESIEAGREAVAMIVGRETSQMDEAAVSRAAIESAAENLSDGVIAPAFWFALAGFPGLLIYKAVNTSDSMIGYLTSKHAEFGWAAAKLDDILNYVPARLTALMIMAVQNKLGSFQNIPRDATRHRSPNAGWPEAAMAVSLDVSLSGPRVYNGVNEDHPFVHPDGQRSIGGDDIMRSVAVLWRVWGLFVGFAALSVLVSLSV